MESSTLNHPGKKKIARQRTTRKSELVVLKMNYENKLTGLFSKVEKTNDAAKIHSACRICVPLLHEYWKSRNLM